jgi:Skp family chaperone for outer membrane proteins
MALTPDEATRLRDMLKEIEELSIKLKTNINTTNLQDVEKNAKEIENLFDILNNRWKDLTKDVDIAVEGFRDLAQEITKQEYIRDKYSDNCP